MQYTINMQGNFVEGQSQLNSTALLKIAAASSPIPIPHMPSPSYPPFLHFQAPPASCPFPPIPSLVRRHPHLSTLLPFSLPPKLINHANIFNLWMMLYLAKNCRENG